MQKLLNTVIAIAIALPASVFAADSSRVEKIEKDTESQREEVRKEITNDITEAEEKLRQLNREVESLRGHQDEKKRVAIYGAAVGSASAGLGIILTISIVKTNPAARIATANLFGIVTLLTGAAAAENAHDAYLDNQKIDDIQAQILGVQGNLAKLKKQLEIK